MGKKQRLDLIIADRYPHFSRNQIQSFIMQGFVSVAGKVETKAGTFIDDDVHIDVNIDEPKYVCRAGHKLEKALRHFMIDVRNKVILDAGLSTGGFTDCLLQAGAKKVYGIDVGYGQVHEKIRTDKRVEIMERTNFRYLKTVGEHVDLITLDLSFISVLKVMDAVCGLLKNGGYLLVLVKPQFEAQRGQVGRGGIVRNDIIHQEVVERVTSGVCDYGFALCGITDSPLLGAKGNKEFLCYFNREE